MPIGYLKKIHGRGQLILTAPADTDTTTVDTYVKIVGTFADGLANNFTIVANKLKWNGKNGTVFLVNGTSDLSVDKTCKTTYGLFKNGVLVPGAETPHDFPASLKVSSISITGIVSLDNGDEIDVHVKSDTINTKISVSTLRVTFWGESS